MELKGKIAVVTGANKGIGLHCVLQLLDKGAKGFKAQDVNVETQQVESASPA